MGAPNFANRTLYHGDNLEFLRGMNSETVQLIATDPPFNKNRDFHATPDSLAAGAKFEDRWRWDVDVHQEWIDAIQDDWPAVWQVIEAAKLAAGKDMAAFLCWLGVRLLEMHRILREDGSLYLHCDATASHYLKAMLDGIFGRKNFLREIIWNYGSPSGGRSSGKLPVKAHETILLYAKTRGNHVYNQQYTPYSEKYVTERFTFVDEDGRRFRTRKRDGGRVTRQYLDESRGVPLSSTWTDIKQLYAYHLVKRKQEEAGYPTQKPLALYERIIKASSNEGDWVLDPFCGCATTPVAAENLGRQWIGMDIWDKAHETVLKRLESLGLGDRPIKVADVGYSTAPPVRSDDNAVAAPPLKLKVQVTEPPGPKMSRQEMKDLLIEQSGIVCAGCDREFDDPLYLELDHNTPRSDGGVNHISNRLLLCGPCNRIKSNTLTLTGLRRENKRRGRMARKT